MTSKLRWVFLLLFMALLLPVSLIVLQVQDTLSEEAERRHQVLAERIFDEMERSLTELLQAEQTRPFDAYRSYYLPNGEASALVRSPLADKPDKPFILAYFQVEPDGGVNTPCLPTLPSPDAEPFRDRDAEAPDTQALDAELSRWLAGVFPRSAPSKQNTPTPTRVAALDSSARQAPGTTYALASKSKSPPAIAVEVTGKQRKPIPLEKFSTNSSMGDKLGVLNRGYEGRSQSPQWVESPKKRAENFEQKNVVDLFPAAEAAAQGATSEEGEIEVKLEPMVSQLLAPERLILYRTVVIGEKGYRQGLLLDVPKLMKHLRDESLGESALGTFDGGTWEALLAQSSPGETLVFRHRFAAPFAELGGLIQLPPLPQTSSESWLRGLALALVLGASVGLLLLYRAVSVQVAFAQRRSDFVSAVSHELKTPITSIRMYAEMLQEDMVESEERRHRYYRIITAEAERLSRLIGNVLELSRIERGSRNVSLTSGRVEPLLEEVRRVLLPHAESQGFELSTQIEADLPLARLERDALLQILFNLVDNAFKYAAKGEPRRILLVARCREEGGVEVGVRDFGPGVPKGQLKRIVEPFYRGERELTRRTKGTGIGLALVKGLAEGMGGALLVRNHPEGGLEVMVALRRGDQTA